MDLTCSYRGCSAKAEISCVCKLREKYFCADHFMSHRKEFPAIRHIFSDIWPEDPEDPGDNEICEVCCLKPPAIACLCNNRASLICSDCISVHSKLGVSHCLEPLKVVSFIQESNVPAYLNRKSKVQKLNEFVLLHQEKCKGLKYEISQLFEDILHQVEATKSKIINQLQVIESNLQGLSEKISNAQFEFRLDQSDHLLRAIEASEYEEIEKKLRGVELCRVTVRKEGFYQALDRMVQVDDLLGGLFSPSQQIEEYFDQFKADMPSSVQELFRNAASAADVERIFVLENYPRVAKDLAVVLGRFSRLSSVDVSKNNIGPAGCQALFSSVSLPLLAELNIAENYILDEGCRYLAEAFASLPALENLFMHKNALTELSGLYLSLNLQFCPGLRLISLNQNTINDEGLSCLAPALVKLKQFEALGLQMNQLTSGCVQSVASLLQITTLQDLSLDDNQIDDKGAVLLMEPIRNLNTNLKIYLRNNLISEKLQEQLTTCNSHGAKITVRYMIY